MPEYLPLPSAGAPPPAMPPKAMEMDDDAPSPRPMPIPVYRPSPSPPSQPVSLGTFAVASDKVERLRQKQRVSAGWGPPQHAHEPTNQAPN